MPRQLEKARMKSNDVANALENSRFQIVVEKLARDTVERLEGGDVAAQEALERLVEHEASKQGPAPAEHHHETRQRARRVAEGDRAKAGPVDLRLLAR
jgi:hypothetical protein